MGRVFCLIGVRLVAKKLHHDTAEYVVQFATNAVCICAIVHSITTAPFIKALGK